MPILLRRCATTHAGAAAVKSGEQTRTVYMRMAILLGTFAIALPFVMSGVALRFGAAVSSRFLERPTRLNSPKFVIPEEPAATVLLDAKSLKAWAITREAFANGYAMRVIPLDVLYLLALASFLGLASAHLASMLHWSATVSIAPTWLWWVFPALYAVSDLIEDVLILAMLSWPSTIDATFGWLSRFRSAKMWTVSVSFIQILFLGILSFI